MFIISPPDLKLRALLARSSPGVTLYQADLQLGDHTMKVKHVSCFSCCALAANACNHFALYRWQGNA